MLNKTFLVAPVRARLLPLWLRALTLVLGVWSTELPKAGAQTMIAADLDLARPWTIEDLGVGGSVGVRLGVPLLGDTVSLIPELGLNYTAFRKHGNQAHPPAVYRGVVGLRLAIGHIVRFGGMAHFGFGYVHWPKHWYENEFGGVMVTDQGVRDVDAGDRFGYQNLSHSCVTYDAGVFLEFSPTPDTTLGLHAAYNRVSDDRKQIEPLDWAQIGLHGSLYLY